MSKTSTALKNATLPICLLALALSACSPAVPLLVVPPKEARPKPDPALMVRPASSAESSKAVQSNMDAWAKSVESLPTK